MTTTGTEDRYYTGLNDGDFHGEVLSKVEYHQHTNRAFHTDINDTVPMTSKTHKISYIFRTRYISYHYKRIIIQLLVNEWSVTDLDFIFSTWHVSLLVDY